MKKFNVGDRVLISFRDVVNGGEKVMTGTISQILKKNSRWRYCVNFQNDEELPIWMPEDRIQLDLEWLRNHKLDNLFNEQKNT